MRRFGFFLAGLLANASASAQDVVTPAESGARRMLEAERAMNEMAHKSGTLAAYRHFVADDGVLFGEDGTVPAVAQLKAQTNSPEPPTWGPFAIVASCDGSVEISQGSFTAADGVRGVYNTVWRRQADGGYRWEFDFAFRLDSIGVPVDPPPIRAAHCGKTTEIQTDADPATIRRSTDGTLAWSIERAADKTGVYRIWLLENGEMQEILRATIRPFG